MVDVNIKASVNGESTNEMRYEYNTFALILIIVKPSRASFINITYAPLFRPAFPCFL